MTENAELPHSRRDIPARERLIVALDVDGKDEALAVVDRLGDAVWFYKLGLQLFMSGEYYELLEELVAREKKVFVDLKLYDVPETVARAVQQLARRRATFVTVHGNERILRAAAERKGDLQILAVTVLTSLDQDDIEAMGFSCSLPELVRHRARRALAVGCDGVVASGREARLLREDPAIGDGLMIVTPGIRDPGAVADDQKRTVTPREAFANGADYLVVGRPVRGATDPRAKAAEIQATIRDVFG